MSVNVNRTHLLNISPKQGAGRYAKVSYPIRYGKFFEIESAQHLFQFNLNGEIRYIRGRGPDWPHPAEWLKRTGGNDWVFYTVSGYDRIFDILGEFYLPCLSYPSNSIWGYDPFSEAGVRNALDALRQLPNTLRTLGNDGFSTEIRDFMERVSRQDAAALRERADTLHAIIGGPVSVLPPDTRHVDYDVIPLIIADGCLYHCRFCCVKSSRSFRPRSEKNILKQIRRLKTFYGADLPNYNALFLGNHDALEAGETRISSAAAEAYTMLEFEKAHIKDPRLFLFGSVDSLLRAENRLFEALDRTPFYTCINIGFESADPGTLALLQKPLEIRKIEEAFQKMLHINRSHPNIEITANFLIGEPLSTDHYRSVAEMIENRLGRYYSKGGIYLSPLDTGRNRRELLAAFFKMKARSRLPVHLYLIQRL